MGLRLEALKGSKQMEQDMFVVEYECMESLTRENAERNGIQFFGNCMQKAFDIG
jgi:hypothetical protein